MSRDRVITLALSALACATLAGLVANRVYLSVQGELHSRCGYDGSVLADPFEISSVAVAVLLGAIGWAFALVTLRTTHLPTAVPIVLVATVSAAAISAWVAAPFSPYLALAIGVCTMYWIRRGST